VHPQGNLADPTGSQHKEKWGVSARLSLEDVHHQIASSTQLLVDNAAA
jgi:hypothetical protein